MTRTYGIGIHLKLERLAWDRSPPNWNSKISEMQIKPSCLQCELEPGVGTATHFAIRTEIMSCAEAPVRPGERVTVIEGRSLQTVTVRQESAPVALPST